MFNPETGKYEARGERKIITVTAGNIAEEIDNYCRIVFGITDRYLVTYKQYEEAFEKVIQTDLWLDIEEQSDIEGVEVMYLKRD